MWARRTPLFLDLLHLTQQPNGAAMMIVDTMMGVQAMVARCPECDTEIRIWDGLCGHAPCFPSAHHATHCLDEAARVNDIGLTIVTTARMSSEGMPRASFWQDKTP